MNAVAGTTVCSSAAESRFRQPNSADESRFVPILTFVIWTVCSVTGIAGFFLPYRRPVAPAKAPEPIVAELLNVELTSEALPPLSVAPPPPNIFEPPPITQPIVTPPTPPMLALAEPSPQVAFAIPVQAPSRIVEAAQASYRAIESAPTAAPAPQTVPFSPLTFGQGEGKQTAPEYPRVALRAGQEGNVVVRLTVGENGRVLAAEAASSCPWPLLNDAALRVVRERWRFSPGPVRAYEVSIRFELRK